MVGEGRGGEVTFRAGKHLGDPVIRGLDMETGLTILPRLPAEGCGLLRVNSYTGARSAASASSQDSLRQV